MTESGRATPGAARRGEGDGGSAIVEFALISVLLLTIVFGVINFGLILSFKQDVTRAAAEGARAGAVALPSVVTGANDTRRLAAATALDEAVAGFDKTCGSGGLTCAVQIHDCQDTPLASNLSPTPDSNGYDDNSQPDCITVRLIYDYDANPLLVPIPLMEPFLPNEIKAKSVVRLNT